MGNIDIAQMYSELFSDNSNFQKVYLIKRSKLYQKIVSILHELKVTSLLDIGCAYGLLVELANANGIDAYGLDLPIDNLMKFHSQLRFSKDKFIYGSLEDQSLIKEIAQKEFQAITVLDTLRHIEKFENLNNLKAEMLIIKEVSDNYYMRRRRRTQFDVKLWKPSDYEEKFPSYKISRIYSSKFLFKIKKPNGLILKAFNLFPSYTIIMEKEKK